MTAAERNVRFLDGCDPAARQDILKNIAAHYGITVVAAYREVAHPEAENLLDYMTEPARGATSVLMARHGLRAGSVAP